MPMLLLTLEVEARALLAALDAVPGAIQRQILPAAKITADAVARETNRRFARAAGGPTRGRHTAEGITVAPTHRGDGYVVYVQSPEMPGLPGWLEFGTHHMLPHPAGGALFAAARLEAGAHERRILDAVQAGIDEKGLGG